MKGKIVVPTRLAAAAALLVAIAGACANSGPGDGDPPDTTTSSTATTPPAPAVLFVGNSLTYYNGGLDTHLAELAASADPPLTIETSNAIDPDATLEDHWDLGKARDAIRQGSWDVVVLQGYPQATSVDRFHEYARLFNEEIENAGARTVLYMTWQLGHPEPLITTETIAEAHTDIGAELGVDVAPAGLAWQRSMEERPDLDLYDPDDLHPSGAGTHLALCVLYATIFDQSPVGLPYQPADLYAVEGYEDVPGLEYQVRKLQLTDDEVTFLQRIAWETVADYQAEQR